MECPYCIHFHTEEAKLEGVPEEGITEAVNIAGGGGYFSTILHGREVDFDGFVDETMDVSLRSKGGCYEVQSASRNRYEIDVIGESCTCPDWELRAPEGGCKHMRRVDHEIKRGRVPRPDGRLPSE